MSNLIDGLTIVKDFITVDEEQKLLKIIENLEWNGSLLRKSRHFGYIYNYKTKTIGKDDYIGNLPEWIKPYINRIYKKGYIDKYPDQITINRYLPGEGIAAHIDVPEVFAEKLYSISIGSGCNIDFQNKTEYHSYYIYPRTFMLMENSARYEYTHCIKRYKSDIVENQKIDRDTPYSIPFRNVIL